MKQALAFSFVLGAAVVLLLDAAADQRIARADGCNASATASATQIKDNRYWISSDVTSGDCAKLECRGFVHYLISYHATNGGKKGQARALTDFRIDSGTQKDHTSIEYVADRGAVIDGVKVESVSCLMLDPSP